MCSLLRPYLAVGFLLFIFGSGAEAATYDTIIDSKTGVRVSIPIDIVGRDSTNQQYGSNWGFRASNLSIDTLNFGSTRTLLDLYNAMKNKAGRIVTNYDYRPDDSFFLKGNDDRGTTQFQVRVRQANGEIRGLSVTYDTRARLEPVVTQVLSSFEPFPTKAPTLVSPPASAASSIAMPSITQPPLLTAAPARPTATQVPPPTPAATMSTTDGLICPANQGPNMRIALVIGNSNYDGGNALPNPANDAAAVALALRDLGFTVIDGINLKKRAMEAKILEFNRMIGQSDGQPLALFYYAGHGIQFHGKNYLVPIDARLEQVTDLEVEAIDIYVVLRQMAAATTCVNLVLLDACRNNPLLDRIGKAKGKGNPVDAAAGFAFDSRTGKPRETYIVYSTAADDVAEDGIGKNSPFTDALLKNIYSPGLDFQLMIRKVRHAVVNATNERQRPEEYGDITKSIVMLPRPVASAPPAIGGPIMRSFDPK